MAGALGIFGAGAAAAGSKKTPQIPKPPTIDEAERNREEFDRLRRRRGVLSNLFSNQQSSPTVATTTLLGQ